MITDETTPEFYLRNAGHWSLAEDVRCMRAELLSLRAKHDKIMEALREAGPALQVAAAEFDKRARYVEKGIGTNKGPNDNWKPSDVAYNTTKRDEFDGIKNKLRALSKLGEEGR